MDFTVKGGVYPTMITPYQNGRIDLGAVEALVEWYWREGCDGIFAACQSSEIMFLSLEERVLLTRTVVRKARALAASDHTRPPMMIVASGHVSDDFGEQVRELTAIAAEGPDALILITNRMDIENTSDEAWIADTERLISHLPSDMPLGLYECPRPYKRLLTEQMIRFCAENQRFYFIKDTCCDAETIRARLALCKGSNLKLFNANAQTLLESYRDGAYGYCGVMANFHPALYTRLFKEQSEALQGYLGLAAMLEGLTYPCCAKYFLDKHIGIPMSTYARSADEAAFSAYQRSCIDQFALLDRAIRDTL